MYHGILKMESFRMDCYIRQCEYVIESEDNGNKYLKLSYNGKANRDRKYYDVKVTDVNSKGILQADYDIMYSNTDTEKDGEIQFRTAEDQEVRKLQWYPE